MTEGPLTSVQLELIARRFRALADPSRLSVLNHLLEAERTVSDLVEISGLGQANVSKHLRVLHDHGFVRRRKEGSWVWYRVADPGVGELCAVMCERLPEPKVRTRERST